MSFRDLIGHRVARDALLGSLRAGRLAHALLLSGPRGVGKATAARALCAARFCSARTEDGDGCGECASCRSVAHGNHPDLEVVVRVPGKRDIGIAQIRGLLEGLHRKPVSADGRAAIVDDAHRMTVEAQNAFLKTLEEPPPGALLVVVTSSPERLLPTVLSRCARFRFASLAAEDMTRYAARAGIDVSRVPVSLARGSPGELLAWSRGDLLEAREELLRFLSSAQASPHGLSAQLVRRAEAGAERTAIDDDAAADERERVREELLRSVRLLESLLRDLQVLAAGGEERLLYHRDRASQLSALAEGLDAADLHAAMLACDECAVDLRRNVDPPLALEGVATRVLQELRPAAGT